MPSDREEIVQAMAIYAQAMDDRGVDPDLSKLRLVFDERTRWTRSNGTTYIGVDAIIASVIRFPYYGSVHVTINQVITVDGDEATATSDYLWLAPGSPWQIRRSGRYHDAFRRTKGRWVFASRVIHSRDKEPLIR